MSLKNSIVSCDFYFCVIFPRYMTSILYDIFPRYDSVGVLSQTSLCWCQIFQRKEKQRGLYSTRLWSMLACSHLLSSSICEKTCIMYLLTHSECGYYFRPACVMNPPRGPTQLSVFQRPRRRWDWNRNWIRWGVMQQTLRELTLVNL